MGIGQGGGEQLPSVAPTSSVSDPVTLPLYLAGQVPVHSGAIWELYIT